MPASRHLGSAEASEYTYLENADAAGLAWEWLRRDAAYRLLDPSIGTAGPFGCTVFPLADPVVQARWGCLNVEKWCHGADRTRLLWSADTDRSVIPVAALPAKSDRPLFDLRRWGDRTTIIHGSRCEHVQIQTVRGQVRLDIHHGTILSGPVELYVDIMSSERSPKRSETLARLSHLLLAGSVAGPDPQPGQFHQRQITALKVFDKLVDGASIRDVGVTLFGNERVVADWGDPSEALKSHSRRLIACARDMSCGGYKSLLSFGLKRC